jgi:hypothetical protein
MPVSRGPEYTLVEQPFKDQLVATGWKHTEGGLVDPSATDRGASAMPYSGTTCARPCIAST